MSINEQTLKRLTIAELEKLLPVLDEAGKSLVEQVIKNKQAGKRRGGFSNVDFARQAGEKGRRSRYGAKEAPQSKKVPKTP